MFTTAPVLSSDPVADPSNDNRRSEATDGMHAVNDRCGQSASPQRWTRSSTPISSLSQYP